MTARHFLMHLAKAYTHFHPIDEHKSFDKQVDSFERKQLKQAISDQLGRMELKCHSAMATNATEDLLSLMKKIRMLQKKLG